MSDEFNFSPVDENNTRESSYLFPRPGKPLGDMCFTQTGTLITQQYVSSAKKISEFDVRPDDVWIISFPRSGTTWLEEMVWLLGNDLNYEKAQVEFLHKRFMNLELVAKNGHFPGSSSFDDLESIRRAPSPRYIKSHLPIELLPKQLTSIQPKIFYVYRNPKDVVVSMFYFFKLVYKFSGTFEQFSDIFLKEQFTNQPYWNHVLGFWNFSKQQNNVKLISYEEMFKNMVKVVETVSAFLGIKITESDLKKLLMHLDIKNMRRNKSINKEEQMLKNKIALNVEEVQFIRRGIVNEWKEIMNSSLTRRFDDWIHEHLKTSDFKPFYLL